MENLNQRFNAPGPNAEFHSEYDIPSDEIQDLISRQPETCSIKIIPIGVAAGTLVLKEPGFGFVMWGFKTSTNAKYSEAFSNVSVNSDGSDPSKIFPSKTGRGYRGSFTELYLSWPVDPNSALNSAYFIIFKSRKMPFMGGLEST